MSERQTILYVDDEPFNLQLFAIHAEEQYNILTAESGAEGLEILKKNPQICVIVTDMKMPGMNGLEFISLAKKKRPDILYFLVTGYDITNEISEAITKKIIVDYYRKPYKVEQILDSITRRLSGN
jgi:two-component system response regulator (stage 0 sporulation protein F)